MDSQSSYHIVALTRRRELRTRLGVGLYLTLTAWVSTRSAPLSAAWFGAVLLGQSLDWVVFAPLREGRADALSPWRLTAYTASVALNAAIYASLSALLWSLGGEGGRIFAMVMLCGSLLHVTLHSYQIRRLLLASVIPMSFFFFGLPIADWLSAPQAKTLSTLAMIMAGVLYLAHLANCVRQASSATALLLEAKGQAEAQRQRAEQEREAAAQANAAKSDFLATVSHEIRTPMNAVISAANLLQRTALSPQQAECVSILLNGGEVLTSLINDVLDLSKIEAGKMTLEEADLDLADAVTSLIKLWEPKAFDKGLILSADLAGDLPARIRTDPLRMKQILFNLLSNAVKFTDRGQITLRAQRITAPHGDEILCLEVQDTGCGIATKDVGRLFNGFEQADASVTRRHGGTGLGLSISHRLAGLMGGSLTATSVLGQGSVFRLDLPLVAAALPLSPTPESDIQTETLAEISLLVAEDHPVNRRVVALLLEPLGWRLTFAKDGAEAIEIADQQVFDAILMDMQMPVMDGLEATRALRDRPGPNQATPILALTANALEHHRQAWLEVGVAYFLTKPINLLDLVAAVTQACEASRAAVLMDGFADQNDQRRAGHDA